MSVPSFNFPRPGLADGTDTDAPGDACAASRPIKTLVLVNGKRRHQASLVNINDSIGRGSTAVDLNTIPTAMVQSIEVLRDGASAQYGSDAIAGVHQPAPARTAATAATRRCATAGAIPSYDMPTAAPTIASRRGADATGRRRRRCQRDRLRRRDADRLGVERPAARRITASSSIAAEYKDQEHTERGGYDLAPAIPVAAGRRVRSARSDVQSLQLLVRRAGARPEDVVRQRRLRLRERRAHVRLGQLAGPRRARRRASIASPTIRRIATCIQIYPDGFLPFIAPEVTDYSAAVGVTLEARRLGHGLLAGLRQEQDGVHHREHAEPLARRRQPDGVRCRRLRLRPAGAERVRRAHGRRSASRRRSTSRSASKRAARSTRSSPASRTRIATAAYCLPNGAPTASGAQVFPGLPPGERRGSEDRTAVGAYVDLEANVTEQFLASVALRGEHYSDFGENLVRQAVGALRLHRAASRCAPRCRTASARRRCSSSSSDHVDQLHRRRAVRHHDVPGRPIRSRSALGAQAARCGGVD